VVFLQLADFFALHRIQQGGPGGARGVPEVLHACGAWVAAPSCGTGGDSASSRGRRRSCLQVASPRCSARVNVTQGTLFPAPALAYAWSGAMKF